MNGITLKQLRYFLALSEKKHFAQAADVCAISQPALSLQIKLLEEQVGQPLLERNTRSVFLTALGREFAKNATEIVRKVDDLSDVVRAHGEDLKGPLRLGVIPTIAPYVLPRLMTQIGEDYPDLELVPRETVTGKLTAALRRGEIDAAIVALPISDPELEEAALCRESFVLVRPLADAAKPVPDVESLQKMRLLLLEEGHCFRDQALDFCDIGQTSARDIMDGSSLTTLVQMVAAGVGVTLIPQMAAKVETAMAAVDSVAFAPPQPQRTIGMIWRRSSPLTSKYRQFAGFVRSIVGQADRMD